MSGVRLSFAALLVSMAGIAGAAPDAVYVNGKIWTGEREDRFAGAFAVEDDRIVAVGDDADVRTLAGEATEIIDLEGRLVTPGFIDNHTHFVGGALALSSVDLRDAATPEEFAQRIAARAEEWPGEWITHGNWDHELWGGELPTRAWIDARTPDTPVFVQRLDGHMGLANSKALELAGIDADTPTPEGGEIIRDASGEPTGLLKDTAMEPVLAVIPEPDEERIDEALQHGFREALSHGVTQVHDMGDGSRGPLEAFRRAHADGKLGIRVYAFVPIAEWSKMADFVRAHGRGDKWLRWGALKGFVDGSLGSMERTMTALRDLRGAWL